MPYIRHQYQPVNILQQFCSHGTILRVSWPQQAERDNDGANCHVGTGQVGKFSNVVQPSGDIG